MGLVVDCFKFDRCQHPERAVAAGAVVEDFEVVEQGGAELDPRLPFLAVEQFRLQSSPERFVRALSKASPTVPIEGTRPAWRTRSLNAQEVNWDP